MSKAPDYTKMSDEELAAAEADLASERTRIQKEQNAAKAEREYRGAMAGMSPESRRLVTIRLSGETGPTGEAASTAEEG